MSVLFDKLKNANSQREVFGKVLTALGRKENFLSNAYLQLTPLCNLSCKMCYAKMLPSEINKMGKHILRFEEWKWYIDQLYEMGTPTLSLTGGECMLHPDFEKIYNYAYDLGFGLVLLTNGTCISEKLFDLFCDKPPDSLSITVYGYSPETYENLCGDSSGFHRVYSNIDKLLEKRFRLLIKYTVTSENIFDLYDTYQYFKQKGIELRYQNSLMVFNKAEYSVISKMVVDEDLYRNTERLINGDAYQQESDEQDRAFVDIMRQNKNHSRKGIRCSAGRCISHIRWDGMMTPCVSFEEFVLDPRKIGLMQAWERMNEWADNYPSLNECDLCVHQMRCHQCVALHYNDIGVPGKPSPRLCWKRNHPIEAQTVEERLVKKGLITAEEIHEAASED